jgi:signal transduction histidine kinase
MRSIFVKNRSKFILISGIGVVILHVFMQLYVRWAKDNYSAEKQVKKIERIITEKQKATSAICERILQKALSSGASSAEMSDFFNQLNQKYEPIHISFYLYSNDSLRQWSSTSVPIASKYPYSYFTEKIFSTSSGIYVPVLRRENMFKVLGLIGVKSVYSISNDYLKNEFFDDYEVFTKFEVLRKPTENTFAINDYRGNFLFALKQKSDDEVIKIPGVKTTLILCFFLEIILLLFFLLLAGNLNPIKKFRVLYTIALFIGLLYAFFQEYYFLLMPDVANFEIFSPEFYASDYDFNSIGELLIFTLLFNFLALGIVVGNQTVRYLNTNLPASVKKILPLTLIPVAILAYLPFGYFCRDLVLNSSVSFNLSNIIDLDIYGFLGIAILALLLIASGMISYSSVKILKGFKISILTATITVIVVTVSAYFIFQERRLISSVLFGSSFFIIYFLLYHFEYHKKLQGVLILAIHFSIYYTYETTDALRIKEIENMKILADKIVQDRDPLAEYLLIETDRQLRNDKIIQSALFSRKSLDNQFYEKITKQYFNGFWLKYGISLSAFDPDKQKSLLDDLNSRYDYSYYLEKIFTSGIPTEVNDWYFIQKSSGRSSYLGRITYVDSSELIPQRAILFIELNSRVISQGAGLPEILLDKSFRSREDFSGFSFAKFIHKNLITQNGTYYYSTKLDSLFLNPNSDLIVKDGYEHLIVSPGANTKVLVSRPVNGFLYYVNFLCYSFLISLLIWAVFLIADLIIKNIRNEEVISFRFRIQLWFVALMTIGFGIAIFFTRIFIIDKFNDKNQSTIQEKLSSIVVDLEENSDGEISRVIKNKEYIEYELSKLSNMFISDINIYDLEGKLYATSRPSLFTSGIISSRMNPIAFDNMKNRGKTGFSQEENIGRLNYMSAYAPLIDENNETVAFINIPYFLKNKELKKEISEAVNSLFNVFVGVIALLLSLSLFISNQIAKPLTLIQANLRRLRYGKGNVKINYRSNDEIGKLVSEYNRMVDELQQSAEMLVQTERESAWREMAQQVAHEIKNPLTPMKLNVQYLEKAYLENRPDFAERMLKFKNTMIEQIEALSRIAAEFSDFAKLPEPKEELIDLKELIKNVVEFNKHNEANTKIIVHPFAGNNNPIIKADHDQLVRVFNNLIKNAIQAIPEEWEGLIEIWLEQTEKYYLVYIKDNGAGIPETMKDKIFTPRFTTKSTGTGLGLAMCKNIMTNLGGEIGFDSAANQGTVFYLMLPKNKD